MSTLSLLVAPTLHHEAVDWASRVVSNGGTASLQTIRAVSRFCRDIDAAGIRSLIYRMNLFCGTGLTAALVPLYRSASFGGTAYGSTTDTNNNFVAGDYTETGSGSGITGNGSTKYISTGVPANTFTASNLHMGMGLLASDANVSAYRIPIGAYRSGLFVYVIATARLDNVLSASFGINGAGSAGPRVDSAVLAPGNIVAAYPSMYRDASKIGVDATASANAGNADAFFVFATNNGSAAQFHSAARLGWYSIGLKMNSSQVTSLNNALLRVYTTLNRS